MQAFWDLDKKEENWGFLLINASNAFNEHKWLSGARFVFNCYKHWAVLVLQGNGSPAVFIFSKEGVTQGDPLSIFAYE
jgi:hypothetical protein